MEKTAKFISRAFCAAIALTAMLISYYYAALPVNISMDIADEFPDGGFSAAVLRPLGEGAGYYVGAVPIKSAETESVSRPYLIPCGTPFGIKMKSDGVIVASVAENSPAERCGLKQGDIITAINGITVRTNTEVSDAIALSPSECVLLLNRDSSELSLCCSPTVEDGVPRIGAWVRDSAAGIGTLTFYDPESGHFGGLGHAVSDVTTGDPVPLYSGEITGADIYDVIKGECGTAGELCGIMLPNSSEGTIAANTRVGVFGYLDSAVEGEALPIAFRQEVKCGDAVILATINGREPQEYSIKIERVNLLDINGPKGMLIKITDERLLDAAGGIVCGMSGSPIIQNGMLVGAVTHVLINDPTKGYAVFAESMTEMLEQCAELSEGSPAA
ncbi:MAG: SpoIVB peptidase [Oscillospiraceae bacterium]|nr:SpoIVB peptidase [Oscillospiraceae bacterium]